MLNQEYVPCDKQIHIKLSEAELQMIRDRMAQMGFKNMSAYVRKMAIDGYYIKVDFKELLEVIRLLRIDSNNINQIAKAANTYGGVDGKIISDMKAEHEKVLKKVEKCFDKYLEIQGLGYKPVLQAQLADENRQSGGLGHAPQQAKSHRVYTDALLANL